MAYIGNSPANVGNYQLLDDISGSFNGSQTSFALASGGAAMTPAKSSQLLINISGVMQQPDDSGADGFLVNATNIVFSSAPAAADTFWGVYLGQSVDVGTVSNDTIATAQIRDAQVTVAKMAVNSIDSDQYVDGSIDTAHVADGAITAAKIVGDAIDGTKLADNAVNSEHITAGAVDDAHLATGITASKLTGALPAISGANLTGISAGATGGGSDEVFVNNSQTVTTDYTVPSGKSASSTGPITLNAGVDITLSAGSRWVIL